MQATWTHSRQRRPRKPSSRLGWPGTRTQCQCLHGPFSYKSPTKVPCSSTSKYRSVSRRRCHGRSRGSSTKSMHLRTYFAVLSTYNCRSVYSSRTVLRGVVRRRTLQCCRGLPENWLNRSRSIQSLATKATHHWTPCRCSWMARNSQMRRCLSWLGIVKARCQAYLDPSEAGEPIFGWRESIPKSLQALAWISLPWWVEKVRPAEPNLSWNEVVSLTRDPCPGEVAWLSSWSHLVLSIDLFLAAPGILLHCGMWP